MKYIKIEKLFNDFKLWKEDNLSIYNTKQREVLEQIQNDFIWKNKQALIKFIVSYFGERFERQYFIDSFIYHQELDMKEVYNEIKIYLKFN